MFLNDMDFGFEDTKVSLSRVVMTNIAPVVAAAGIAAASSIAGGLLSDEPEGPQKPKILPKTVSGETATDFDILYNAQAEKDMGALTTQLGDWAQNDRQFFENTFQPFQDSIVQTNQTLLPAIERTAGATLEQNAKDLMSNASLKESFRNVIGATGADIGDVAGRFAAELDNLPTSQERVAEALSNTELQFGQAARDLQKDMASRGQKVSEATKRQLAIDKATAKAGVAGAAAEAARAERRGALAEGAGVLSGVQQAQTGQLSNVQAGQQVGLATPQVGGVVTPGNELTNIQAGLTETSATKQLGTTSDTSSVEFTQKGIKSPPKLDAEGNVIKDDNNTGNVRFGGVGPPPVQPTVFGGGPGIGLGGLDGGGEGNSGIGVAGGNPGSGEGAAGTPGAGIGGVM